VVVAEEVACLDEAPLRDRHKLTRARQLRSSHKKNLLLCHLHCIPPHKSLPPPQSQSQPAHPLSLRLPLGGQRLQSNPFLSQLQSRRLLKSLTPSLLSPTTLSRQQRTRETKRSLLLMSPRLLLLNHQAPAVRIQVLAGTLSIPLLLALPLFLCLCPKGDTRRLESQLL
jgi:hypothetical protein